MTTITPTTLSNRELIESTVRAARDERSATVELLALLGELDERKLYLGEGCSSLFTYCTQVLHLSEQAAYHRIEAARAAGRFPGILDLLSNGALTLTTVAMLRPHLTLENHEALLVAATHKSKREVEQQIACLAPKPDVRTLIRRIPEIPPVGAATSPTAVATTTKPMLPATLARESPRPLISPLATDRYLLRVTLSGEAHANLRRAQDLMRHTIPTGDAATVLERALALLVNQLERVKTAKSCGTRAKVEGPATTNPSNGGPAPKRYIPALVKRTVWVRDQGRCAFIGSEGRCTETGHLEYHHVIPFVRGGPASVENIALRCRAHNSFESEAIFGLWHKISPELGPDRVR